MHPNRHPRRTSWTRGTSGKRQDTRDKCPVNQTTGTNVRDRFHDGQMSERVSPRINVPKWPNIQFSGDDLVQAETGGGEGVRAVCQGDAHRDAPIAAGGDAGPQDDASFLEGDGAAGLGVAIDLGLGEIGEVVARNPGVGGGIQAEVGRCRRRA